MFERAADASDRLLYVLSARGQMSWPAFKKIFDELHIQQNAAPGDSERESRFARWQTVTVLDALAHCDFSFGESGGRVYVAPPVLARLPRAGLPQAVLCGARSPTTHGQVEAACDANGASLEWEAPPASSQREVTLVPPRVAMQATTESELKAVARQLGVHYEEQPPSWKLLHRAGSLDEMLACCRPLPANDLQGWRRKEFNASTLRIREGLRATPDFADETANARLVCYTHPRTQASRNYLARNGEFLPVDIDWGRYGVLRNEGCDVLVYDERSFRLAVPADAPLPRLLARSLALCSGHAPRFLPSQAALWNSPELRGFNVYRWIPPQIAERVAAKLGQRLSMAEIKDRPL